MKMPQHCRCCSEVIYSKTPKNIFQESHSIIFRIHALTGLWIRENKEYPDHICGPCEVALREAIRFRERIILTQKKLQTQSNSTLQDLKESRNSIEEETIETELDVDEDQVYDEDDVVIHEVESIDDDDRIVGDNNQQAKPPSSSIYASLNFDNSQSKKMPRIQWNKLSEDEVVALKRERRKRDCICDMCGRHFSCPSNFKVHLLRHTGIKNYNCTHCSQKFYTAHLLRRHERTHFCDRPYQCHYCEQAFTNTGGRIQHERTRHTHIKPFKCKECDKSFVTGGKLNTHMLSHTGVRSFHCESCKVSFMRRSHLSAHYRSKSHAQSSSMGTEKLHDNIANMNIETELELVSSSKSL